MSRLVSKKTGLFGAVMLIATAAGTMAVNHTGAEEGLRLRTYRDIAGIPTDCYGETKGARMGQTFTKAECDAKLLRRLDEFSGKVEACIHKPMSDKTLVAFVGTAYNIGAGGFCSSTAARRYNAGDFVGGCQALGYWNQAKVHGRMEPVPGLTARRARETKLCLEGLKR